MKAIIPVAGAGTRLRPHTHTQPKPLVPIAGKPILGHIVDNLYENGIRDFLFVIGYLGDKIEDYIVNTYKDTINAEFVLQEPRIGSAHALWMARDFIKDEKELLIVLGDTIVEMNYTNFFCIQNTVVAVRKVDNPRIFGIVEPDKHGVIKKLIEKPRIPKSNLALVGAYKISNVPLLLDAIKTIMNHSASANSSWEYHLTDALMEMVKQGEQITFMEVDNWFDCGKKDTLLEANASLLRRHGFKTSISADYPSCIIIQPVRFGKQCKLENSIIGPNVAIGDHTHISNSIIQNSIIGSFSELAHATLNRSIIGSDSSLKGLVQSLNIGDSTEINFTSTE
ncbi:MAG: glucose-1-phosphate thymidylyltransferase [Flexibacter sp. CG_4_10_14_3_um_filter_32_15]|nr:MAG: glucose-1-phosphate thymidylyltransferase [Flexibacter sp. CG_4_10_14_3_um_filter_32_15]